MDYDKKFKLKKDHDDKNCHECEDILDVMNLFQKKEATKGKRKNTSK